MVGSFYYTTTYSRMKNTEPSGGVSEERKNASSNENNVETPPDPAREREIANPLIKVAWKERKGRPPT